jgi:hypothetical protein
VTPQSSGSCFTIYLLCSFLFFVSCLCLRARLFLGRSGFSLKLELWNVNGGHLVVGVCLRFYCQIPLRLVPRL